MGALGKLMTSSGFEDILIEAGICARGSIAKVMSGKHYNRAIRVHQRTNDAIERVMLKQFCVHTSVTNITSNGNDENPLSDSFSLAECPSTTTFYEAFNNLKFMELVDRFKVEVRSGLLGKTAMFWVMFSDCVWVLFKFQQAVKQNNFDMYLDSLRQLSSLLFSSDHQN